MKLKKFDDYLKTRLDSNEIQEVECEIEYEISSGNVFLDLGLPNHEELLKAAEAKHEKELKEKK